MTIEKLKSGSYRIKQMVNGKTYSVTVPTKPTQKEATILLADKMKEIVPEKKSDGLSVQAYFDKYIALKEKEGKSPTTIRGYHFLFKNTPSWFKDLRFYDVTQKDFQKAINEYKDGRSAKTTKNMASLVASVFAEYRDGIKFNVKLPTSEKLIQYEPTTEDIARIIEYSKDSRYYLLLQLTAMGVRRGEAMVITDKDIDIHNVLTIDKDYAVDKNNVVHIKDHPKTSASYRRIPIPEDLANAIREQGYVYNGSPHAINKFLSKAQKDLGIPHFRLHMMRHFCAAHLHSLNFTDEQIMSWQGWDDPSTMAKTYRYNLDPDKSLKAMTDSFKAIRG